MITCQKTGLTKKTSSMTNQVTVSCGNCNSTGVKQLKHGRPGTDPHSVYNGPWCVHQQHQCPVCRGTGQRMVRNPQRPGKAVIVDSVTEMDLETERIKGLI